MVSPPNAGQGIIGIKGGGTRYCFWPTAYPSPLQPADVLIGQLPASNLLEGLPLFDSSSQSSGGGEASSTLTQLAKSAGSQTQPKVAAGKMVSVGAGLPAVPRKLMEQILAGQYIDFSELPPAKGRTRPLSSQEEGHIIVVRAEEVSGARKMIPDLATWTQCFALYMAIITTKEPDRTNNLLAYMVTIAKASIKYSWPSWVVYDQNFRQEAADNGLKDWAKVDPSIYTQCFTNAAISEERWCKNCQSIDHNSGSCPLQRYRSEPGSSPSNGAGPSRKRPSSDQNPQPTKKRPPPHSLPQTCRLYNRFNGDCKFGDLCTYQHKCESCGKYGHPRRRCGDQQKPKGTQ